MAIELQQLIDVTTIQISKRISQLRFDYSKQKNTKLLCFNFQRLVVNQIFYLLSEFKQKVGTKRNTLIEPRTENQMTMLPDQASNN